MRLNTNTRIRELITVYLDDKKEPDAAEVYILGNKLEGPGYVIRQMRKDGRLASVLDVDVDNLPENQYTQDMAVFEKVEGKVRIQIADDSSMFGEK